MDAHIQKLIGRESRGLQTHSIAAVKIHACSRCPRAELCGSPQAAPAPVAGGGATKFIKCGLMSLRA